MESGIYHSSLLPLLSSYKNSDWEEILKEKCVENRNERELLVGNTTLDALVEILFDRLKRNNNDWTRENCERLVVVGSKLQMNDFLPNNGKMSEVCWCCSLYVNCREIFY